MAFEDDHDIPVSGAVFSFGRSRFANNIPGKFWIRNDEVIDVACGEEHTILVTESGRIFAFGANNWGQLGLGNNVHQDKPACVKSLKSEGETAIIIACGRNHTLIGTRSGRVYGFGSNSDNQINSEDVDSFHSPTLIDELKGRQWKQLAAGGDFSAALSQNGEIYTWGSNEEGQLGLANHDMRCMSHPTKVEIPDAVVCIAAGHYHCAAVTRGGRLYTWGDTEGGKLGLESHQTASKNNYKPQEVSTIKGPVRWVTCGNSHTLVVTDAGQVYTFGEGSNGQLGLGNTHLTSSKPALLESLEGVIVRCGSAGEAHSAVITESGALYTFGEARHGKLCIGETDFVNQLRPFRVKRFKGFHVNKVSCGGCHTMVLAKRVEINNGHCVDDNTLIENQSGSESEDNPLTLRSAQSLRPLRRRPNNAKGDTVDGLSVSLRAREKRNDLNHVKENSLDIERQLPELRLSPRPDNLSRTAPATFLSHETERRKSEEENLSSRQKPIPRRRRNLAESPPLVALKEKVQFSAAPISEDFSDSHFLKNTTTNKLNETPKDDEYKVNDELSKAITKFDTMLRNLSDEEHSPKNETSPPTPTPPSSPPPVRKPRLKNLNNDDSPLTDNQIKEISDASLIEEKNTSTHDEEEKLIVPKKRNKKQRLPMKKKFEDDLPEKILVPEADGQQPKKGDRELPAIDSNTNIESPNSRKPDVKRDSPEVEILGEKMKHLPSPSESNIKSEPKPQQLKTKPDSVDEIVEEKEDVVEESSLETPIEEGDKQPETVSRVGCRGGSKPPSSTSTGEGSENKQKLLVESDDHLRQPEKTDTTACGCSGRNNNENIENPDDNIKDKNV